MEKKLDDFEAVRILVQALGGFDKNDQERIIRWAREKIGLTVSTRSSETGVLPAGYSSGAGQIPSAGKTSDIKTFVASKNPTNDRQLVATIAYYYRFEAPESERKDAIAAADLQEACRKVNKPRFKYPAQTLVNAHNAGLLDKAGGGVYRINTVGENLVAMTLPDSKETLRPKKNSGKK